MKEKDQERKSLRKEIWMIYMPMELALQEMPVLSDRE
jgi:hypothetical protein